MKWKLFVAKLNNLEIKPKTKERNMNGHGNPYFIPISRRFEVTCCQTPSCWDL